MPKKKNWISKLKTKVHMILKGPEYYESIGGKHVKPIKPKKPKKPVKTYRKKVRTGATERGMRAAGLSKKEIAKFGGK